MIDVDILLGNPIPIQLNNASCSKNFKGLFIKKYKLKDFLVPNIGEEKYVSWVNSIILKPIDIADWLWSEQKIYYKTIDDWTFVISRCIKDEKGTLIEDSPILEGLRFILGYKNIFPIIVPNGETSETRFFFDIYDDDLNVKDYGSYDKHFLVRIDKNNFEKIRERIIQVNYIQPSELSSWNYAYEKHEKKALKYYYEKRKNQKNQKPKYDFSLETILRFLKNETNTTYKDLLNESLYEIYNSYKMKSTTFQTLALNMGIYSGNVKMDSNIRDSLIYGIIHNEKQEKNLASGNGLENIQVE